MIDWDSCVLWLDNKHFSESYWWDRSKYVNNGVVNGAVWKEDSFYFDGVNDVVNCGNNESLRIDDEISIEFLFIPYENGYIAMKRNWDNWNKACGIFWGYENSNRVGFYGNSASHVDSSNVYEANKKHHVIVTVKQGGKTLFSQGGGTRTLKYPGLHPHRTSSLQGCTGHPALARPCHQPMYYPKGCCERYRIHGSGH